MENDGLFRLMVLNLVKQYLHELPYPKTTVILNNSDYATEIMDYASNYANHHPDEQREKISYVTSSFTPITNNFGTGEIATVVDYLDKVIAMVREEIG